MPAWGAYGRNRYSPIAGSRAPLLPKRTQPVAQAAVPTGGAWGATMSDLSDVGGYTPNYAALIQADPEMVAGLAGFRGADIADEAQLGETLAAAGRAYEQGVGEYGRQLARGTAQGDVDLAARGTLASGGLGVLRGVLNEAYTRGINQLGEARAGAERGARASLATNKAAREMQRLMLEAQTANRLAQDERYQARAGERARWNPVVGMYVGPSGQMYDERGNAFGAPVQVNWGAQNAQLAAMERERQAAIAAARRPMTPVRGLPVPTAPRGMYGRR